MPQELTSSAFDFCLEGIPDHEAGTECDAVGLPHGQLCGAASICLERSDLPPGNNCYDVCRGTEGALNASGHSDCPTGSYCQQFAVGLGVCLDR